MYIYVLCVSLSLRDFSPFPLWKKIVRFDPLLLRDHFLIRSVVRVNWSSLNLVEEQWADWRFRVDFFGLGFVSHSDSFGLVVNRRKRAVVFPFWGAMASSFDRWEKDPFFSAAEEVQDSADRWVFCLLLGRFLSCNGCSLHRNAAFVTLPRTKAQICGWIGSYIEDVHSGPVLPVFSCDLSCQNFTFLLFTKDGATVSLWCGSEDCVVHFCLWTCPFGTHLVGSPVFNSRQFTFQQRWMRLNIWFWRMQSTYRTWVHAKTDAANEWNLEQLCRDLHTAIGTTKWQVHL